MLITPLNGGKGLFNVKVNAVDKRALVYDQLVEVPVDSGELVYRLDELLNSAGPLVLLVDVLLGNEHLKLTSSHLLPVFRVQLDRVVDGSFLVYFQALEVLLLLISQLFRGLTNLLRQ